MSLIVQKFGGTSVANVDRIKEIALRIKSEKAKNNQLIIIVSAMAGATNHLVTLCNEISSLVTAHQLAEYDAALSSAEVVTAALLALSLQEQQVDARSIFAWQLPISTDSNYSKALVSSVATELIKDCISRDVIPVIAGFQGVNQEQRLSTLGRSGSDITAAAIAAAVKADRCDIYTDVDGVFTADPRIIHDAKKITLLSFEEMLEFASSGAKVLHPRCVELARRYEVPVRVLSSFSPGEGTLITTRDRIMENGVITGITANKNILKVLIEKPKISLIELCTLFSKHKVNIEFIQGGDSADHYNVVCQLADNKQLQHLLTTLKHKKQIENFIIDSSITAIAIISYGIKNDISLLGKILSILEKSTVIVSMINVSEISIMLLVREQDVDKATRELHHLLIP